MFDNLADKLQGVFSGLKSKGRLTEEDIDAAMREIRLALLEADVNFKVVKTFVADTKERALSSEVMDSLTPAQNVIKIVLDELTGLLGSQAAELELDASRIPNVIMLVGLQGSGKTTAASKLAYLLKNRGHRPLLVAADVYRPAAADQLETLGSEIDVSVFRGDGKDPVRIAEESIRHAIDSLKSVVIVDTAGRLHVDEDMMAEASAIKAAVDPDEVLMVVDAMTGQDIVNVVSSFAEQVEFDGVIISKLDGDARGGGALSVRSVTGKPIKFVSMGEKPDSLEVFHPDRMAKRILGMGDVVSIIEKAQQHADEAQAAEAERILNEGFTFDDYLSQVGQIRKMGGLGSLVSSLPGGDKLMGSGQVDERSLDRIEAIIRSMTKEERARPKVINGSRRQRIAKGAGVEVFDVNQLIKQFNEASKMMNKFKHEMDGGGGKKGRRKKRRGLGGMGDIQEMMRKMGM